MDLKQLQTFGLPVFGVAAIAFGGFWIAEQRSNVQLNRQLGKAEDQLSDSQAALEGLQEANERLQERLQEIPVLALFGEDDIPAGGNGEVTLPSAMWEEFATQASAVAEATPTNVTSTTSTSASARPTRTPEEEAERKARMEERQQQRLAIRNQMNDELQARREFFAMINTEGLSPEYAQANERVVEAMGEMQVLLAKMSVEGLDRYERRDLHRTIRQTYREVEDLMSTQQDILLYDYAELELGLKGEAKQDFIDYMKAVDTYTTLPRPSRRPSGGTR